MLENIIAWLEFRHFVLCCLLILLSPNILEFSGVVFASHKPLSRLGFYLDMFLIRS